MKTNKKDLCIVSILLLISGLFCFLLYSGVFFTNDGKTVMIYVQGEVHSTHSIQEDLIIELAENDCTLTVVIEDAHAFVRSSACTGQDCVHSMPISKAGQSILCAPQQVLITIQSPDEPDAVVR